MLAFCIILGDTIPNVIAAMFPSLPSTPFLWLLTNRRAVIVILVLGVSYPLSLYRDIAKVNDQHPFHLMYLAKDGTVSEGVNVGISKHGGKSLSCNSLRSLTDIESGHTISDSYTRRRDTGRPQGKSERVALHQRRFCPSSWRDCLRICLPYDSRSANS